MVIKLGNLVIFLIGHDNLVKHSNLWKLWKSMYDKFGYFMKYEYLWEFQVIS